VREWVNKCVGIAGSCFRLVNSRTRVDPNRFSWVGSSFFCLMRPPCVLGGYTPGCIMKFARLAIVVVRFPPYLRYQTGVNICSPLFSGCRLFPSSLYVLVFYPFMPFFISALARRNREREERRRLLPMMPLLLVLIP
jgi:hypothetical protein